MRTFKNAALAIASVVAIGLAGCKGDTGADGTNGTNGTNGNPGSSTGTISGTLTYSNLAGTPATGVAVSLTPDVGVAPVTSGSDGKYELDNVPIGIYSVKFDGGAAFTPAVVVSNVVVAAGKTTSVAPTLTTTNPIKISLTDPTAPFAPLAVTKPAGYGKAVTLHAKATGGTAPYTYTWAFVSGPYSTAPTLTNPNDGTVTFTTDTFANIAKSKAIAGDPTKTPPVVAKGLVIPTRAQMVNITPSILAGMTYSLKVTAKDANGISNSATVTVAPTSLSTGNAQTNASGNAYAALGMMYTASDATAGTQSPSWTLTPPSGGTATLDSTSILNPSFIPDATGNWTLTNAATTHTITVTVGKYVGSQPNNGPQYCGVCHSSSTVGGGYTNVAGKMTAWKNSAHGNHFFKFMEYDSTGALVWKKDAAGNYLQAPTADSTHFWSNVGPMTTFEYGMTGAEGAHYGASCTACHTTGFNATPSAVGLRNNNFYQMNFDKASGTNWVFPTVAQFVATFAIPAPPPDVATAAPNKTFYNDPNIDHSLEGMQCEACHGPLSLHANAGNAPAPVWNVGTCAYCHDRPSNHDRVFLWSQSAHSSYDLTTEGSVNSNAVSFTAASATQNGVPGGAASCGRCHAAQGFGAYLDQRTGACSSFTNAAPYAGTPGYSTLGASGPLVIQNSNGTCTYIDSAANVTAATTFFTNLGMTDAKVENVSCQVCHDPHSTELKVMDSTGLLANGYQMNGAGSGAICMVCHNQRNGVRGDGIAPPNAGIASPHAPTQADLLMGVNAYFMSTYSGSTLSKHANVLDTCAGCHLKLHPDSISPTNTNHTFRVDGTICSACHGPSMSLEGVKNQFLAARADIGNGITAGLNTAIGAGNLFLKANQFNADGSVNSNASAQFQVATPNAIVGVDVVSATRTGAYLMLHFANALTTVPAGFTQTDPTTVLVSSANIMTGTGTTAVISATGVFAKAMWNYQLVSSVSSDEFGQPNPAANVIHNPSFVFNVLANTKKALAGAGLGTL
jgi:hypothetical protein